ncbi:hypothetical protein H206_01726 [Candidatus Electrothrix aarhusensis]|uniref:Uncharacterized protein n=1 Tax=Candidatus Electrothrix aarhusensis TaxID=1859131 RepID=A0A3S3R6Q1_9BACT|nr:hypothetical protein H206_01726 [Candidatus Electrothrix aarhusensis]
MSLKEYELFHGVVLARLVRRDKPVTLRLIETNTTESWSVYRINDVNIFFKHSSNPRNLIKGGISWTFSFTKSQLEQINTSTELALICGSKDTKSKKMEICFIEQKEVSRLLSKSSKSITAHLKPNKSFRVSSSAIADKVIISRSAIEKYEVPS